MNKTNKRVVLITGASSGIGKACAEHLAKQGYRVYGTSRRIQQINPTSFEMIQMDVDNDKSVEQGINFILEKEGRLDVVVNNAGFGLAGAIEDTSTEEAKSQLETNFFGVFRVCKAVLPAMRKQQNGYIINISSIGGLIGLPFQGFYSSAKFAVEGFTEALSAEVKSFGIKVVLIEPGDFCTGLTSHRINTLQSLKSVYGERFKNALQVIESDETKGCNPGEIAPFIEKIINESSPCLRYSIGHITQRLAVLLKRIIPERWFEWILIKCY